MAYMDCSDWSKCTLCGQCLIQCPVLSLDENQARTEIQALIKGEKAPHVFSRCTLCYGCNNFCPEGLRPHELILQRVLESRKKPVPAMIPYMCNGMTQPSFFPDLYRSLGPEETKILEKWSEIPSKSEDILWIGCIGRMSCRDLEHSRVLRSLPKYGPPDMCCGELHYRFGSWEAYVQRTRATLARFEQLDIKRMVCYCGSCYSFLSVFLPQVYGKALPFQLISLYQWLAEKMAAGEISVRKPLNYNAAIHEACYVSELGDSFASDLRTLYTAAGVKCLELEHHGTQNLSCGGASMSRSQNIFKSILPAQNRKYREAKATGAKNMAVNCPGCYLTLYFTAWMKGIKLHYMPDELLKAFGDDITRPLQKNIPAILRTFAKRSPLLLKKVAPDFGLKPETSHFTQP